MDAFVNSAVRRDSGYRGSFEPHEYARVSAFYEAHRELSPTPLTSLPGLAARLAVGHLAIKDETSRFGLEAFKIAGARYAIEHLGQAALRQGVVCATAGNHGRAVARAAHEMGASCTVFVPAAPPDASELELGTRRSRLSAMQADRARTVEVSGTYEQAVARAAEHATRHGTIVVSDTSWPGYDEIPRLIMLGYTRIFDEASRQWELPPEIVLVQGGVGGLVCAAANWFAVRYGVARPFLIACEPETAACLLESARAGRMVDLARVRPPSFEPRTPSPEPPRQNSMMAGLRCSVPSPAAWPSIHYGVDAFLSIPDSLALAAMELLSRPVNGDAAIVAGPSGACGVGALLALLNAREAFAVRDASRLGRSSRVMAIVTEAP